MHDNPRRYTSYFQTLDQNSIPLTKRIDINLAIYIIWYLELIVEVNRKQNIEMHYLSVSEQ